MNPCQTTFSVTALANAIACKLQTPEEIELVSALFVQLGDTLATIAAQQALCEAAAARVKQAASGSAGS